MSGQLPASEDLARAFRYGESFEQLAVASATLALAEEQRTANLIALLAAEYHPGRLLLDAPAERDAVEQEIRGRLGLPFSGGAA